jgi:hypothetical protein
MPTREHFKINLNSGLWYSKTIDNNCHIKKTNIRDERLNENYSIR